MTKPRSNRLGMYDDLRPVLDAALEHGGGMYECATHGDAIHWRQRAYRFRKLYAEVHGLKNSSKYDVLMMPRIPDDSSTVIIQIRKPVGVFVPNESRTDFVSTDPLFEEAEALARRLEGEN